jgi:hypothetical protein
MFVAAAFAAAHMFLSLVPPAEPGAGLFDAPSRVDAQASRQLGHSMT